MVITFNEVDSKYYDQITTIVKENINSDKVNIEDVINDVLVHINNILPNYNPYKCNAFINYLTVVVKRKTIDLTRSIKKRVELVSIDECDPNDLEYVESNNYGIDHYVSLIKDNLNDSEYNIFNAYYLESLSYKELATKFQITEGATKIKLFRVRKKIKTFLN